MEKAPRMKILDAENDLISNHQNCFKRKLALTMIEVVFDAWPQTVHYHNGMSIAQLTDPINLGNAKTIFQ